MNLASDLSDVDNFMIEFKRLKQRQPPPDLSCIQDFETFDEVSHKDTEINSLTVPIKPVPCGLKPVEEWKAYRLPQCPGFIFIVNPFIDGYHTYWARRCVCDYPDMPNVTNLDAHINREEIGNLWKHNQELEKKGVCITAKESLMMKLRWVTLGYHYDWDTKKYYKGRHTAFPSDLSCLCEYIMEALGFNNFKSEAAIVNYYHMNSTLAGHTDHSEFDHTAPLISISFGQDAIFLLGGETKSVKPVAMYLHSGDICIMSGRSRLAYHGVPRIMTADKRRIDRTFDKNINKVFTNQCDTNEQEWAKSQNCDCSDDENKVFTNQCDMNKQEQIKADNCDSQYTVDSSLFFKYLDCTRININVRQVLPPGAEFPDETSLCMTKTTDICMPSEPKIQKND